MCRLRSIATHRDHFVHRLSVRLSHFPKLCFAGDTCIPRNAATILFKLRIYKKLKISGEIWSPWNRPYPVIWKTVPIRINILKLHQVNFCIENITLSKFQGDTRNSFPDIAFRIYINFYEKLAICTWVGTKYCILPTLSQRVLYLKTLYL